MPGPRAADEALAWVREAMLANLYITDAHFLQRCRERRFSVFDAKKIVATATSCVPYVGAPCLAGGTTWRVTGTALDGSVAKLGVEAYRDHLGRQIILVTIMDG